MTGPLIDEDSQAFSARIFRELISSLNMGPAEQELLSRQVAQRLGNVQGVEHVTFVPSDPTNPNSPLVVDRRGSLDGGPK